MSRHITRQDTLTGATSPVGKVTPQFVGQIYMLDGLDSSIYIAKTLSSNGWLEIPKAEELPDGIDIPMIEPVWEVNIGNINAVCNSLNGTFVKFKLNDGEWQTSNRFNNLNPFVDYRFYGEMSNGLITYTTFKTPKANQVIPSVPTIVDVQDNLITVSVEAGCKILYGNTHYASPNTFNNLQPNTSYIFNTIRPGTATLNEAVSDGVSVTTLIKFSGLRVFTTPFDHSVLLSTNKKIFGMGRNTYHNLGTGIKSNAVTRPTESVFFDYEDTDIIEIALDDGFAFILKKDGTLWSFGTENSGHGQNPLPMDEDALTPPLPIEDPNVKSSVKRISCGGSHNMILKTDGYLYAAGYNDYGQCGKNSNGANVESWGKAWSKVTSHSGFSDVSCGKYSTMAIRSGAVLGCGYNSYGQLGDGTETHRTTFTSSNISSGAANVYCGDDHTIVLKTDGTLWGTGQNLYGQLGDGTGEFYILRFKQVTTNVKKAAVGTAHTAIIKNDGTLWMTGTNEYGQCGLGDTAGAKIYSFMNTGLTNVVDVACTDSSTIAIKSDGTIWAAGRNSAGELGLGHTNVVKTFTQIKGAQKPVATFNNDTLFKISNDKIVIENTTPVSALLKTKDNKNARITLETDANTTIDNSGVYQIMHFKEMNE